MITTVVKLTTWTGSERRIEALERHPQPLDGVPDSDGIGIPLGYPSNGSDRLDAEVDLSELNSLRCAAPWVRESGSSSPLSSR